MMTNRRIIVGCLKFELFRQATIDLAKEKSLKLIDIYQVMLEQENPKALLRADGLHFTLEAYRLLVEEILTVIKNFIQ